MSIRGHQQSKRIRRQRTLSQNSMIMLGPGSGAGAMKVVGSSGSSRGPSARAAAPTVAASSFGVQSMQSSSAMAVSCDGGTQELVVRLDGVQVERENSPPRRLSESSQRRYGLRGQRTAIPAPTSGGAHLIVYALFVPRLSCSWPRCTCGTKTLPPLHLLLATMSSDYDYDMASPLKQAAIRASIPVHGKPRALQIFNPSSTFAFSVEVRVLQGATARFDTIRNAVNTFITSSFSHVYLPSTLQGWEDVPILAQSVDRIIASESANASLSVSIEESALQIYVYQPNDSNAFEELTSGDGKGDSEEVTAASICELPSLGWEGLWESLIYAEDIKSKLLDYIYATVIFSDADIDCEYSSSAQTSCS